MALVQFWPPQPQHLCDLGDRTLEAGDTFEVAEDGLDDVLAEPDFRRAPAQRKDTRKPEKDESQSPDGT